MNQPEHLDLRCDWTALTLHLKRTFDTEEEVDQGEVREWLPEDDDDWYDPDCHTTERRRYYRQA